MLIIIGTLILSNIFDIFQKFKAIHITNQNFWQLTFYKTPYLLNQVSSLISFIATLLLVKRLTSYNELLALLCTGINLRKIIFIPMLTSFLFGIFMLVVLNPIGTNGLEKYSILENKITKKRHQEVNDFKSEFVFIDNNNINKRIFLAKKIIFSTQIFKNLTILTVDKNNNFLKRIEAPKAKLIDNKLLLYNPIIYKIDSFVKKEKLILLTNLSMIKLKHKIKPPEMLSIIEIHKAIKRLLEFGIPYIDYEIFYYKQLFSPIVMSIMVVLGFCFFTLKDRDNTQNKLLILGLLIGFISYFIIEITFKILSYNNFTRLSAITIPNITILIISIGYINFKVKKRENI